MNFKTHAPARREGGDSATKHSQRRRVATAFDYDSPKVHAARMNLPLYVHFTHRAAYFIFPAEQPPCWGNNYPENGLVKPPRRDTRALSPAGMFGGKVPLRLAAQINRPHAPLAPIRSTPAYFLCEWGVYELELKNTRPG